MNRIYKFRAWDKEYKKMLEGYKHPYGHSGLWLDIETGNLTHIQRGEEGVECSIHKFKNVVLMQYTGRKDKNRKGIYEGDILKVKIPNYTHDYVEAEVKFNSGCFGIEVIGNPILNNAVGQFKAFSKNTKNIEVIGNVWENPELYEENK